MPLSGRRGLLPPPGSAMGVPGTYFASPVFGSYIVGGGYGPVGSGGPTIRGAYPGKIKRIILFFFIKNLKTTNNSTKTNGMFGKVQDILEHLLHRIQHEMLSLMYMFDLEEEDQDLEVISLRQVLLQDIVIQIQQPYIPQRQQHQQREWDIHFTERDKNGNTILIVLKVENKLHKQKIKIKITIYLFYKEIEIREKKNKF
jgi:hypothetical protein